MKKRIGPLIINNSQNQNFSNSKVENPLTELKTENHFIENKSKDLQNYHENPFEFSSKNNQDKELSLNKISLNISGNDRITPNVKIKRVKSRNTRFLILL